MDPSNATSASTSARLRGIASFLLRPSVGPPLRATLLVRLAVGGVFLTSGLVKFLFDDQGPGRFAKIGLPAATQIAYFVGAIEVLCGALLVLGLFTRLAALPLVVDMMVALVTTKVPFLFGAGPEPVAALPKTGFWAFAYQARLDVTMLAACTYIVAVGAGLWSLDALLSRRRREGHRRTDPRLGGTEASPS